MTWLIGFAVFALVLTAWVRWWPLSVLRRLRWYDDAPGYAPAEEGCIDALTRSMLTDSDARLRTLGFAPLGWMAVGDCTRADGHTDFARVYRHADSESYALATPLDYIDPRLPVNIEFATYPEDGLPLSTVNGRTQCLLLSPPGFRMSDAWASSLDDQWAHHLRTIEGTERKRKTLSIQALCEISNDARAAYLAAVQAQGLMRRDGRARRLTWRGASTLLHRIRTYAPKLARALSGQPRPELPIDAQVRYHQRQHAVLGTHSGNAAGLMQWVLILGSLALFALSLGWRLDAGFVALLIAVLIVHESGHLLAMKLFGFRDLRLLFLPFLGAIATGRRDDAPAWQHAVISLAGPLPGLIMAGAAVWLIPDPWPDWLTTTVILAVVLNYFNLLPIHPLDGGQMCSVLLFRRWPRVEFLFGAVGVAGFFLLAWSFDRPELVAVACLLAFTLPHRWRMARLTTRLRRPIAAGRRLETIYEALDDAGIKADPGHRYPLAQQLVAMLESPLPRLRDSVAGLALYAAALGCVPAVVMAVVPEAMYAWIPAAFTPATPHFDEDAELARLPDDAARVDTLLEWASYSMYEDTALVAGYLDRADRLIAASDADPHLRARAMYLRAELDLSAASSDRAGAYERLREALSVLDGAADPAIADRVRIHTILADEARARDDLASAANHLSAGLDVLRAHPLEPSTIVEWPYLAQQAADIRYRQGDVAAAGALLNEAHAVMSAAVTADPSAGYSLLSSLMPLVDFKLDTGDVTDARMLMDALLAAPDTDPVIVDWLAPQRAWLDLHTGDSAAAARRYAALVPDDGQPSRRGPFGDALMLAYLLAAQDAVRDPAATQTYARLDALLESEDYLTLDLLTQLLRGQSPDDVSYSTYRQSTDKVVADTLAFYFR